MLYQCQRNARQVGSGNSGRHGWESISNRNDRQLQQRDRQRGDEEGNEKRRQLRCESSQQQNHGQCGTAHSESVDAGGADRSKVHRPFGDELGWQRAGAQSQEVAHLAGRDDDGNAGGESGDHRHRNEANQPADARVACGNQNDAGQEGSHEQPRIAVRGDNTGDDDDKRTGRPADLYARAAEQ